MQNHPNAASAGEPVNALVPGHKEAQFQPHRRGDTIRRHHTHSAYTKRETMAETLMKQYEALRLDATAAGHHNAPGRRNTPWSHTERRAHRHQLHRTISADGVTAVTTHLGPTTCAKRGYQHLEHRQVPNRRCRAEYAAHHALRLCRLDGSAAAAQHQPLSGGLATLPDGLPPKHEEIGPRMYENIAHTTRLRDVRQYVPPAGRGKDAVDVGMRGRVHVGSTCS